MPPRPHTAKDPCFWATGQGMSGNARGPIMSPMAEARSLLCASAMAMAPWCIVGEHGCRQPLAMAGGALLGAATSLPPTLVLTLTWGSSGPSAKGLVDSSHTARLRTSFSFELDWKRPGEWSALGGAQGTPPTY